MNLSESLPDTTDDDRRRAVLLAVMILPGVSALCSLAVLVVLLVALVP